jgi:hypothetical protein
MKQAWPITSTEDGIVIAGKLRQNPNALWESLRRCEPGANETAERPEQDSKHFLWIYSTDDEMQIDSRDEHLTKASVRRARTRVSTAKFTRRTE